MKSRLSNFITASLIVFCCFPVLAQNFTSNVTLTGKIADLKNDELKVEFSLENRSNDHIYVATEPVSVIGKAGYYLLSDSKDRSLLKISSLVYPAPPYFPYIDKRGVSLKKLNSGERFNETIAIKFPARETDPPFYGKESDRRRFKLSEIKTVELTIGYFIEEAGILDFLKGKPYGWFIVGGEVLASGKHKNQNFLEIQRLASTLIEKSVVP